MSSAVVKPTGGSRTPPTKTGPPRKHVSRMGADDLRGAIEGCQETKEKGGEGVVIRRSMTDGILRNMKHKEGMMKTLQGRITFSLVAVGVLLLVLAVMAAAVFGVM